MSLRNAWFSGNLKELNLINSSYRYSFSYMEVTFTVTIITIDFRNGYLAIYWQVQLLHRKTTPSSFSSFAIVVITVDSHIAVATALSFVPSDFMTSFIVIAKYFPWNFFYS